MTDYYEELQLSRSIGLDGLKNELVKRESLWRRREVVAPEKAQKMLSLISDAKKAFQTEISRNEYDRSIANSAPAQANSDRRQVFERWKAAARAYYGSGDSDLAKCALNRAALYAGQEDADYYRLSAQISLELKDFEQAERSSRKAMELEPGSAENELVKGLILARMASQPGAKTEANLERAKVQIQTALRKAETSGDTAAQANALGILARLQYAGPDADSQAVEEMARNAIRLGESWGNAQKVLDELKEKKELTDNLKFRPVYGKAQEYERDGSVEALEKALQYYRSIPGWEDAEKRAELCQTKLAEAKYSLACEEMGKGTYDGYQNAIRLFLETAGQADSSERLKVCKSRIEKIEKTTLKTKTAKKALFVAALAIMCTAIAICGIVLILYWILHL